MLLKAKLMIINQHPLVFQYALFIFQTQIQRIASGNNNVESIFEEQNLLEGLRRLKNK